jgi:hypothetical protein
VVATGGKPWQMPQARTGQKQAKTVAVGCDQLPRRAHGKEGSPVRVRKRALQKRRTPAPFRSDRLIAERCFAPAQGRAAHRQNGGCECRAAAVAEAFARAAACERDHEAANGNVGELGENSVGAGADLFGRLLLAELFDERGDQLLQAQAVGGLVGADVLESRVDEFADSLLDLVADLAHALERLSGGIVDLPVLDLGGDEGAARLAAEGNRPVGVQLHLEVTFGQIAAAGSSPADSAQISAGA